MVLVSWFSFSGDLLFLSTLFILPMLRYDLSFFLERERVRYVQFYLGIFLGLQFLFLSLFVFFVHLPTYIPTETWWRNGLGL